jgi:hypothetical protein
LTALPIASVLTAAPGEGRGVSVTVEIEPCAEAVCGGDGGGGGTTGTPSPVGPPLAATGVDLGFLPVVALALVVLGAVLLLRGIVARRSASLRVSAATPYSVVSDHNGLGGADATVRAESSTPRSRFSSRGTERDEG